MLILLIILLLVFGGGGGYYGHTRWGPGGGADRRQQMQKKDGQIAHRTILARSATSEETLTNLAIRHAQASVVYVVGRSSGVGRTRTRLRPTKIKTPA
jgi:hypothetical protein